MWEIQTSTTSGRGEERREGQSGGNVSKEGRKTQIRMYVCMHACTTLKLQLWVEQRPKQVHKKSSGF